MNKKGYLTLFNKKLTMKRMNLLRNGLGAALMLFSVTACDKDDDTMETANARVLVVHASPDAPAVDLLVDNVKVNSAALAYPANTGYLDVASGTRNFKVNAAGTTTTVINADVPLMENMAYSVFAYDRVAQIKPLVVMDNLATPAAGKAHIRFLHLSPGAPAVTIGVLNGSTFAPVFSNRSFETAATATANQAFTPVDAGTYTFDVRLTDGTTSVLTVPNIALQAGKIYTVFARGIVGNTASPLSASLIVHN